MMNNKTFFLTLIFISFSLASIAQGVTIGANTPPDSSAVLDLRSNSKGFALPRLTTAQRNAINNPVLGLQIYNTDSDCIEAYFASGGWKPVQCGCNAFPNALFNVPNATDSVPVTISSPTPNMTYNWTFQNGNPATSNTQSTQVIWDSTGTFAITLTVTDSAGCSSTHTDTITVDSCLSGSLTFNYTGNLQYWTVPSCVTQIVVEAWGAEGGTSTGENGNQNFSGGLGAYIKGTFTVSPGQSITILVGQKGSNSNCGAGGGGGSFVVTGNSLMLAAGGGGGGFHCNALGGVNGVDGQAGNSGTSGSCTPNRSPQSGGTNGNGGTSNYGGGGGGWLTDGVCQTNSNTRGRAYPGQGGSPGGGYGGGGGYYAGCCGGSGGGGGYSGGGGTSSDGCAGGGGGSYNAGTNQTNTTGVRQGNGKVVITW